MTIATNSSAESSEGEMVEIDAVDVVADGPPRGEVRADGAKNAALPLLVASLLAEQGVTILNDVPRVRDVTLLIEIIRRLGAGVDCDWSIGRVQIDASTIDSDKPDEELCGKLRGSLMLLAPLLARMGSAQIGRPGGCSIGARNFDIHLTALKQLRAQVFQDGSILRCSSSRLQGTSILLDMPTHTGTQQAIMAAVCASGQTHLLNAAKEPEVRQLCEVLNRMGAQIEGVGTSDLKIQGVKQLVGVETTVEPSRIETGLYAMVGSLPGGHLKIENFSREAEPVLVKLREMGVKIWQSGSVMEIKAPSQLAPTSVVTWPYPGFPTDSQAHIMSLCTFADGRSTIHERLYENRFQQAAELQRMGADILVHHDLAVVTGPTRLRGAEVRATDLQAGASLMLAAVGAEGRTTIHNFGQVQRGYPRVLEKFAMLGTNVKAVGS